MANYKKMYHRAFNALTDAEGLIAQAGRMMHSAQQECEDMFVEADETPIDLADHNPKE